MSNVHRSLHATHLDTEFGKLYARGAISAASVNEDFICFWRRGCVDGLQDTRAFLRHELHHTELVVLCEGQRHRLEHSRRKTRLQNEAVFAFDQFQSGVECDRESDTSIWHKERVALQFPTLV